MDLLTINQLKIPATIGMHAWEQQITRNLIFDIKLAINTKKTAQNDCIEHTVDYAAVAELLIQFLQKNSFQLVETVAEQAAQLLLQQLSIEWIELSVTKSHPLPNLASVCVTIQRGATDHSR